MMMWQKNGAMDFATLLTFISSSAFLYASWLTSIVFCAANDHHVLLVASASFFPIGVVHGIGIWFGGWA